MSAVLVLLVCLYWQYIPAFHSDEGVVTSHDYIVEALASRLD
jgi:hypothetical protein